MMLENIIAALISTLGVAAIGAVAVWLKNQKWVKKLGLENLVDSLAKSACNFAEDYGKSKKLAGREKMNKARVEFRKSLEKHGIKMTDEEVNIRVAAIFNEYKGVIENK